MERLRARGARRGRRGLGRSEQRGGGASAPSSRACARASRVLAGGGSALDAVERAVVVLEDHPLFNAGRGAALTRAGEVELDAAVMDGRTPRRGSRRLRARHRQPGARRRASCSNARPTCFSSGPAPRRSPWPTASRAVDPASLVTPPRRADVGSARRRARGTRRGRHRRAPWRATRPGTSPRRPRPAGAAGQLPGRVGDSPLVGAGTWADDASCAVSATGAGEAFVRAAFAHEVDAQLRLLGAGLERRLPRGAGARRGARRRGRLRRGRPRRPHRPALHDARHGARLGGARGRALRRARAATPLIRPWRREALPGVRESG